jgi:RNA polymerase sigma-70 factor (ECF subfamily)
MAQEIFLKVYRALPQFERKSTFSTWLYSVATRHCLNQLEYRRRRPRIQEAVSPTRSGGNPRPLEDWVADPTPGADHVLEQADLRRVVQEQLLTLAPEYRAVLVLRDIQGLSYDEVGALLGLPSGTVRSRLHRARMELKERLKAHR